MNNKNVFEIDSFSMLETYLSYAVSGAKNNLEPNQNTKNGKVIGRTSWMHIGWRGGRGVKLLPHGKYVNKNAIKTKIGTPLAILS